MLGAATQAVNNAGASFTTRGHVFEHNPAGDVVCRACRARCPPDKSPKQSEFALGAAQLTSADVSAVSPACAQVKVWEWRAPQLLEPALQRKNEKHKDRRVNVRHLRKTITPRIINGVTQPALVPPPARVPAAVLALRAARAPRAARLAAAAAVTWAGTQAQPAPGITARNAAGNAANAAVDDGFHSESMEDEPEPVSGQVRSGPVACATDSTGFGHTLC